MSKPEFLKLQIMPHLEVAGSHITYLWVYDSGKDEDPSDQHEEDKGVRAGSFTSHVDDH